MSLKFGRVVMIVYSVGSRKVVTGLGLIILCVVLSHSFHVVVANGTTGWCRRTDIELKDFVF